MVMVLSVCGPISDIDLLLEGIGLLNGVRIAPNRCESWTDGEITVSVLVSIDADLMRRDCMRAIESETEP